MNNRTCPKCKQAHVIPDGYCGVCRECTLPALSAQETAAVAGAAPCSAACERGMLALIAERDTAEEAISHAYYLVIGRSPEWSNNWGYPQCLEEIEDACSLLRQAAKPPNSDLSRSGDNPRR